jgi:hypothetical protein
MRRTSRKRASKVIWHQDGVLAGWPMAREDLAEVEEAAVDQDLGPSRDEERRVASPSR